MYAVLNPDLALRSWKDAPFVLRIRNSKTHLFVDEKVFFLLCLANGFFDLPEQGFAPLLVRDGTLIPCEKNEKQLSEWQKLKHYDNHYMFNINLMITGRCNYNCRHCFNAVDNLHLQSELSLEDIEKILDDAAACGIYGVSLTGGEPMLHPGFDKILDMIYEKGLFVFQINTNGYFIDQAFLEHLKALGASPPIKISFDGLGCHDWMRDHKGAEKRTLEAIRLCKEAGLNVMIQLNVNQKTLPSVEESLDLLDSMNVDMTRIIPTIDTPRWVVNGKSDSMTYKKYMDCALEILTKYKQKSHKMALWFWQMFYYYPQQKAYSFLPVIKFKKGSFDPAQSPCETAREMIAIGSEGNVYPCLQMSGECLKIGQLYGNIHEQSLKELLQDSDYMTCMCHTTGERLAHNKKCQKCPYLKYCGMGCPALALGNPDTKDRLDGYDDMKCLFYTERYDLKIQEILKDCKDYTGVKIEPEKDPEEIKKEKVSEI